MASNDPYGKSWAEQYDYHDHDDDQTSPINGKVGNNGNKSGKSLTKKYSKKFGDSFNKTKEAASCSMEKTKDSVSSGMKKVKGGASGGFSWFKQRFSKSSLSDK